MKILGVILLSFFYINSSVGFCSLSSHKHSTTKTAHHKKAKKGKTKNHLLKRLDKKGHKQLRKNKKDEKIARCVQQQKRGSFLSNKCKKLLGVSIQNNKPIATTPQSTSTVVIAPAPQQIAPAQQSDGDVGASLLGSILGNSDGDDSAGGDDDSAGDDANESSDDDSAPEGDDS